jgi:nucleoside-diphosphate-sugar epimerase
VKNLWQGRRVLITGATGFIGGLLAQRLAQAGAALWTGVLPGEAPERVAALPLHAERIAVEMRDADSVRKVLAAAAPEVIFHLAAVGVSDRGVDPELVLAVNTGGVVHLLEALRTTAGNGECAPRVVLVGTCYEYGANGSSDFDLCLDPFDFYAASKIAAWAFGRAYWRVCGLPVVTVRLFQVYGPGQPAHTLVPAAISAALAGRDFPMTLGEQQRDFVYVEDVVEGLLAAALAPGVEGQALDLGTGMAHALRQVVEQIWALAGGTGQVLAGALPYRRGEALALVANAARAAELTGWRAHTDLEDGLRQTIHEYATRLPRQ